MCVNVHFQDAPINCISSWGEKGRGRGSRQERREGAHGPPKADSNPLHLYISKQIGGVDDKVLKDKHLVEYHALEGGHWLSPGEAPQPGVPAQPAAPRPRPSALGASPPHLPPSVVCSSFCLVPSSMRASASVRSVSLLLRGKKVDLMQTPTLILTLTSACHHVGPLPSGRTQHACALRRQGWFVCGSFCLERHSPRHLLGQLPRRECHLLREAMVKNCSTCPSLSPFSALPLEHLPPSDTQFIHFCILFSASTTGS